jgi:hypothetical protein
MKKNLRAVPVDPGIRITINTDAIPDYVAMDLAQATIALVKREFAKPGVREDFERWKKERYSRKEHR